MSNNEAKDFDLLRYEERQKQADIECDEDLADFKYELTNAISSVEDKIDRSDLLDAMKEVLEVEFKIKVNIEEVKKHADLNYADNLSSMLNRWN